MTQNVQLCAEISLPALQALLGEYGLKVVMLPDGADIPGSYWGDAGSGFGAGLSLYSPGHADAFRPA